MSNITYEVRSLPGTVAIDGNTIVGYAIVYNSMSEDLGGFREIIKPGSLQTIIDSNRAIKALLEHNAEKLLGSSADGTLKLSEDNIGLRYSIDLPATSYAADLRAILAANP